MKILFYPPAPLYHQHYGVILDEAIIEAKKGNEVYFVYNNCCTGICTINMEVSSYKCKQCKMLNKKTLRLLPKSIKIINIEQYWESKNDQMFSYNTIDDIKKLQYKGVYIGYAALSSYYTMFRNLLPKIDDNYRKYFNKIFAATCHLTDALEKAINDIKPDKIYFFNTRYFEWRPPYDLARREGIEAVSCEMSGGFGEEFFKERFINSTPHAIEMRQCRINQRWQECPLSESEKIKLGKEFFNRRRHGIAAGDRVYISNQVAGQLPANWDPKKRNIVIFNSSEDEYAAIGDEYDKLSLFKSQYKGICYILESLKENNDIHIYLRIHPNLAKVPYRYHKELELLPELYDHITVIPAADKVSTYDIMDAAEKVVVFGSTMGLEAAYWGKPVILLAGAEYYYMDLCYTPKTKEELVLLLNEKLSPKSTDDAIKMGFFMLYKNEKEYYKYIDFNFENDKFLGVPILNVHYLKLFGSSKLYAFYRKIVNKFLKRNNTMIDVPLEEDKDCEL